MRRVFLAFVVVLCSAGVAAAQGGIFQSGTVYAGPGASARSAGTKTTGRRTPMPLRTRTTA